MGKEMISQGAQYNKMMELAISSEGGVEKLEKIMDLQDRWEAKEAKKSFTLALSQFQQSCPIIEKKKKGHNYMYATLPSIVAQIKKPLGDCGLSYRFEQNHLEAGLIKVTCVLSHVDGHSESTAMESLADGTGSKNQIQSIGSASSYLMRYTLIGSLGIATADSDDDGAKANDINIQDLMAYNAAVRELFPSVSAIKMGLEMDTEESLTEASNAMFELTHDELRSIWRPPTKGGVFTTKELDTMKSSEFRALTPNEMINSNVAAD